MFHWLSLKSPAFFGYVKMLNVHSSQCEVKLEQAMSQGSSDDVLQGEHHNLSVQLVLLLLESPTKKLRSCMDNELSQKDATRMRNKK